MSDAKGGMGAEVGARKINEDGDVVDESGAIESDKGLAYVIFLFMLAFDVLGLWKLFEIITFLI